jgi:hypothetical protein
MVNLDEIEETRLQILVINSRHWLFLWIFPFRDIFDAIRGVS